MNKVIIRKSQLSELSQLLEFEQKIIQAERSYGITIRDDEINYYDLEEFIKSDNSEVVVAELDGQLIASGSAKIKKSDSYLTHDYHSYLGFMYVAPEHRGKGVISLIMKSLMEWSKQKGVAEICLDVYHKNDAAIKAYEKIGFTPNLVEMRLDVNDLK